jgi:L-methionine (R)-S-oxide reductase
MPPPNKTVELVKTIANTISPRSMKAYLIADAIRRARNYRWVGIYDVGTDNICVIAWAGPTSPTHPTFPISAGLNGRAIRERRTVVVGNVSSDPDYLATLSSTKAEMVVPVFARATAGEIIGTIDVESESANAFTQDDTRFVEDCARAVTNIWSNGGSS